MARVASQTSVIHPPHHNLGPRRPSAGADDHQPASPFALLLDTADTQPPAKDQGGPPARTSATVDIRSNRGETQPPVKFKSDDPTTADTQEAPSQSAATECLADTAETTAAKTDQQDGSATADAAEAALTAAATGDPTAAKCAPVQAVAAAPISVDTALAAAQATTTDGGEPAQAVALGDALKAGVAAGPADGGEPAQAVALGDALKAGAAAVTADGGEPAQAVALGDGFKAGVAAVKADGSEPAQTVALGDALKAGAAAVKADESEPAQVLALDDVRKSGVAAVKTDGAPKSPAVRKDTNGAETPDGLSSPATGETSEMNADGAAPGAGQGQADTLPQDKLRALRGHSGGQVGAEGQKPDEIFNPTAGAQVDDAARGANATTQTVNAVLQTPDRLAGPAAPTSPTQTQTALDATPVPIAGLAIEIAARAQAGRNRFEIRLDPPELGRIDVRIDVDRSGEVTSRLFVDRADTLEHLRRDAGDLQRALQDAGLKTADNGLQFTLRDQGFAGRDDGPARPDVARIVVPETGLASDETQQVGYGRAAWARGEVDIRV